MSISKEQEREELHKTIWKIANELRGSVDGWDFKQYVLGLLFYRFISENIEHYVNQNQRKAGIQNFEYRNISDDQALMGRTQILEEKGFFILPSELFCNVRKNAEKNENLNVVISNIFNNIESSARGTASEDDMKGLFDDFTIDNKLGNTVDERNEKLVKMLNAIGELKLGDYYDNNIDLFGDAYEFLMTMYASSAGKSGGEFFTPQEVGELLARIVIQDKTSVNKVYDPACGSGGLLLKFAKILGKENVKQGFFGQEINLTTYNLARINMFLHNINYNNFHIARGDTLIHPEHWDDEPFDAIVSNPPYSIKWAGNSNPLLINDERFAPAGVLAPQKYADLAFTMHMLSWLSPKGTAAIVEFPGVLYRPGAEYKIRKYLVDNNFVDTIIQLPSDLFFGTNIATCIMVLKKNKSDTNILFVDASSEYELNPNRMKNATNKNRLSNENIENIIDLVNKRQDKEKLSKLISYEEIINNDYNLSINSFVIREDTTTELDISEINNKIDNLLISQEQIRTELFYINNLINKKVLNQDVKLMKIGEISKYRRGSFPQPYTDLKYYGGEYAMPFVQVADVGDNMKLNDTTAKTISKIAQPKSVFVPKNTVIVTLQGTIGRVAITHYDSYVDRTIAIFEDLSEEILPKYFAYQLQRVFGIKKKSARGSTIKTITKEEFTEFEIPIPSIEQQKEIVKYLDIFYNLKLNILEELTLRDEQLEYYRNFLLTEKGNEDYE